MIKERIRNLRHYLKDHQIGAAVILKPENQRYYSGFTGTDGALLVSAKTACLLTDARYLEQAAQESPLYKIIDHKGRLMEIAADLCSVEQLTVIGYEDKFLTYQAYLALSGGLEERYFEPISFEELRQVKDKVEIDNIKQACHIADEAFKKLLPCIKLGVTEQYLAMQLECNMLQLGSEEKSFTTIVASGKRSSMPHGVASAKVIESGDFITFDFGAIYKGYHSDITRTVVIGKASAEQKRIYDAVLQAQLLGVQTIKAGIAGYTVDKVCRDYFASIDLGTYFTHGLGHGVGLDIHELPVLSPRSKGILCENMIVTVEPGLYIEGFGGVRIEDSVLVTTDGCEILTHTSKNLLEI